MAKPKAPGAAKKRERPAVPNVNPDDMIACYTDYASMRGDIARIGQRIAVMFARYEKQGVNPKGIKRAYSLAQKDPDVVAAQLRMETEYLAVLKIIDTEANGQGTFAAGLAVTVMQPSAGSTERLAMARAHTDGYNSGLAGGSKDACRHEAGTQAAVKWLVGWHDGYADRIAKNPDADKTKVASTSRARREPVKADVETEVAAVENKLKKPSAPLEVVH